MWQDRLGEGERGSALQERGGPAGGEEETVAGHRCQWQWTSLSGEGHIFRGVGILTPFDPGARGGQICPLRMQTRIPEEKQWVEILIIFVYS